MRPLRFSITVLSVLLLSLIATSCSKKAETSSIMDNRLLTYLPESTLGFFTWDTSSESYQKLKKTALAGNPTKSLELIKKIQEQGNSPELAKITPILEGLVETGLVAKTPSDPEVIKTGLAFFEVDPTNLPGAGVYLSGTEGTVLSDKVAKLEQLIAKQGYKINKETFGSVGGFSVDIEEAKANGFPIDKIYIASDKEKIALGTSAAIASRFLGAESKETGIQKIKDSNEYKQAVKGLDNAASGMSFAFFDVNKLVKTIEKATGQPDADLNSIPVDSFAVSSTMNDSLSNTLTLALNPKNELQKKVINTLSSGGKNDIVKKVPADMMLLISLDGSTISSVKNAALADVPAEALGGMQSMIDLVDSVKTLAIGIRGASGATPFPEVLILAESAKAQDIQGLLRMQAEGALGASGMQLPWQEKDISGAKVSYVMSPFGVGGYLTSNNGLVIVSSNEKLVSDVISSDKNSDSSLLASLSDTSKEMVSNSKPALVAYSDFRKIGDALGGVQSSLAMFTGGQASIKPEDLEAIKQMGTVMLSVNVADNLAKLQSNYEITEKKG